MSKRNSLKDFNAVVVCILIFELCERLAFYSINANFVRFCTIYLDVDNVTAINLSLVFSGFIYVFCVFNGWIADSVLGKFYTILLSGIIYFMGVALISVVTYDFAPIYALKTIDKRIFSGFGLGLILISTGGIKTPVGPFGAEQIRVKNENVTRLYYLWLYWFVNLGSAIAFVVVTYVQQNINFFYGFLIPLSSMFVALVIFIIPKRWYVENYKIPKGSVFTFIQITMESVKRKSKTKSKYSNLFDYARLENGGSYEDNTINDLKQILRIIPVFITIIPFDITYFQMQSTFLIQGERLDLNISSFIIPVASLSVFNSMVILFIIPLVAVLIYPIIIKCFGRPPSALQRIGFGLLLSALSVTFAGLLEIARKNDMKYNLHPQTIFGQTYNISSISILMQIPQFSLVGAARVFTGATALEFAYSQAPISQQSLITGLYYMMVGMSSFASSLLISVVNVNEEDPWMPNDIDKGHYEYFFFLLGGIILLDLIIFIFIARSYKYAISDDETPLVVRYSQIPSSEDEMMLK